MELPPGRVEIFTRDGRKFERVGTDIPGSVEYPMNWDDIISKFSDCASFAAVPQSADKIRAVHKTVQKLELVKDATEILRSLS